MDEPNALDQLSGRVKLLTRLVWLQTALLIVLSARVIFGVDAAGWALGLVLLALVVRFFAWMVNEGRKPLQPQSDSASGGEPAQ